MPVAPSSAAFPPYPRYFSVPRWLADEKVGGGVRPTTPAADANCPFQTRDLAALGLQDAGRGRAQRLELQHPAAQCLGDGEFVRDRDDHIVALAVDHSPVFSPRRPLCISAKILAAALFEKFPEVRNGSAVFVLFCQHRLVVRRNATVAVERDRGIGRLDIQTPNTVVPVICQHDAVLRAHTVHERTHDLCFGVHRHCSLAAVQRDVRGQLDLLRRDGVLSAACRAGQLAVRILVEVAVLHKVQFARTAQRRAIRAAINIVLTPQPDSKFRRRNIDCATVVVCQRQSYTAV